MGACVKQKAGFIAPAFCEQGLTHYMMSNPASLWDKETETIHHKQTESVVLPTPCYQSPFFWKFWISDIFKN